MWTCPKCKREFKNTNQDHYCSEAPKTIAEYIAMQDEALQPRLQTIYETLKAALPDVQEKLSWQMPTFWKGRNLIHFAAFKNHISIFPGGEATTVFADKLTNYKTSKGVIQLQHKQELPLALLTELAQWCHEKYAK